MDNRQDFIIVLYEPTEKNAKGVKSTVYHFIGEPKQKNVSEFVIGCWLQLDILRPGCWENEKMFIFSDGGPKHFRVSKLLAFFCLERQRHTIPSSGKHPSVFYHVFAPYHGHNICDVSAAQAKEALRNTMRDHQAPLTSTLQITSVVNGVKHHFAYAAPPNRSYGDIRTMDGITSYFSYTLKDGEVRGYLSGEDMLAHRANDLHKTKKRASVKDIVPVITWKVANDAPKL